MWHTYPTNWIILNSNTNKEFNFRTSHLSKTEIVWLYWVQSPLSLILSINTYRHLNRMYPRSAVYCQKSNQPQDYSKVIKSIRIISHIEIFRISFHPKAILFSRIQSPKIFLLIVHLDSLNLKIYELQNLLLIHLYSSSVNFLLFF